MIFKSIKELKDDRKEVIISSKGRNIKIKLIQETESVAWDAYVHNHPDATLYHCYGWKNVIETVYGHKAYYLMAINEGNHPEFLPLCGILPLVHMKHFIFGNKLISIPFFDMAGILADTPEVAQTLLSEAIQLGKSLKATTLELRHTKPLPALNPTSPRNLTNSTNPITRTHKSRMILTLPSSSEELMNSFKSKLRSQIKKPIKEGLTSKIGGAELLDDFYTVFAENMRDLGSPVHAKNLIRSTLDEFRDVAKISIVYCNQIPVACGMIIGFKQILQNPWASALKRYARQGPNMLLYWSMLEFACNNGYRYFDFGRSTPDEGTYRFKEQWGAKPEPLHWHFVSLNGQPADQGATDKSKFDKAIYYWQKLPVSVTKLAGPLIRKHIGL